MFNTVYSNFVDAGSELEFKKLVDSIDYKWIEKHVVLSRHSIQIAKCVEWKNCATCGKQRSKIFNILKTRFIPPPIAMRQSENGPVLIKPEDVKDDDFWPDITFRLAYLKGELSGSKVRMDSYNKELSEDDLKKLICPICKVQFQNQTFMKAHRAAMHKFSYTILIDVSH